MMTSFKVNRTRCIFCAISSAILATLVIAIVNAEDIPVPSATPDPMSVPLDAPAPAPSEPSLAPAPATPAPQSPVGTQTNPNVRKKIVYKEKSYYDFEDVLINGNLRKPDGSFIFRKNQTNFSSALNLRRSFIPELKESTSNTR